MNQLQQNLAHVIDHATPSLLAISEKDFSTKPSPERWSKKEILGHLIDSAYNNHQRFIRAEGRTNLIFDGYDQVAWVKRNAYQERVASNIIQCWKVANQHLATMIGQINTEVLQQKSNEHNFHQIGMRPVAASEPVSLAYMIEDYIFHAEHHLSQIIDNYIWITK